MIKAICFDLDGVYFTGQGKKAFHQNLLQLVGDDTKVSDFLYKSTEMHEFVTGKISEGDFWNAARTVLSLELNDKEFRDLWVKEYQIDQNVRDFVLAVKSKGYKTCICSNNNPARIAALEEKFQFLGDFDVRIFSYEVGFTKPAKKIFQALIDESQVQASELVYADDNADRIAGARELGINVFVYEDFEQFKSQLANLGVK